MNARMDTRIITLAREILDDLDAALEHTDTLESIFHQREAWRRFGQRARGIVEAVANTDKSQFEVIEIGGGFVVQNKNGEHLTYILDEDTARALASNNKED
jgi:shikimate kinase